MGSISRRTFFGTAATGFAALPLSLAAAAKLQTRMENDLSISSEGKRLVDSFGREVSVNKSVLRVSPAEPHSQSVAAAIDPSLLATMCRASFVGQRVGDDLVEAALPLTGRLFMNSDVNREAAMVLREANVDLIISIERPDNISAEACNELQLLAKTPVLYLDPTRLSYSEIFDILGAILERERRASMLSDYMEDVYRLLAQYREFAAGIDQLKTVFVAQGQYGTITKTATSFHDAFLSMLGASNIAQMKTEDRSAVVSTEWVARHNPDLVIFENWSTYKSVVSGRGSIYELWKQVPAIARGDYHCAPFGWLSFPPLQAQAIGSIWLERTLYPQAHDVDMVLWAERYFDLFLDRRIDRQDLRIWLAHSHGRSFPKRII